MQSRWSGGIWLGKCHGSDEHVIGMFDGSLLTARSVQPRDDHVSADLLKSVVCIPGSARSRREAPPEPQPAPPRVEREDVRRWQITREIFNEYGATPGCGKCEDWSRNRRTQRGHSQACRARLERVLRSDPHFGPRIAGSEARQRARDEPRLQPEQAGAEAGEPEGPAVEPVPDDPEPQGTNPWKLKMNLNLPMNFEMS